MFEFGNYAASEIKKNWSDRWWWRQRLQDHLIGPIQGYIYGDDGIDVMAQDWDNLIVLDACRHDIFRQVVGTERFDDYRVVSSKGSATPEWIRENFMGRKFGDTVYISANPWVSKFAENSFHEVENLWLENFNVEVADLIDADVLKDTDADTSQPIGAETMTVHALEASQEYDDKRLIVHYFQPHAPYIGNPDGTRKDPAQVDPDFHPGKPLKDGDVQKKAVWDAYESNLRYVWHHASKLASELNGKTVITSDHGELFGEWQKPFPIRGYDHPPNVRHPLLVNVPWAIIDGTRRDIVDDGTRSMEVDQNVVNDRLKDLGYRI